MAVPKMRGSQSITALTQAKTRRSKCVAVLALLKKRGWLCVAALAVALCATAAAARADEIRLKDGKKLYGVIVAYEDNMFKVKTDFGYVLVEKDKIASIIPTTPASATPKTEKTPAAKKEPATEAQPKAEEAVASSADGTSEATNASAKSVESATGKREKTSPKITNAAVKPSAPMNTKTNAVAPNIAASASAPASTLTVSAAQPAAPKAPEPPAMRENIQGNLYTNYTHGFKMYKAPSWDLLEDARQALPNAIVAMGTQNESTLLVIGQEKTKEPLEPAAATVEKRLSDIYDNYRRITQRKTTVGGLPAVEYHYRGEADGHDWSGTVAVIARGPEIFTVLGMTYADDDLIQIQENVISRAIASLEFNVH
ncbi:MAG: hypothetical protein WA639_08445 [Candidatus Acidiferrum sp.]